MIDTLIITPSIVAMKSSQSDLLSQEEDEDDYEYHVKKIDRKEQFNTPVECILSPLAQLWYSYNRHRC